MALLDSFVAVSVKTPLSDGHPGIEMVEAVKFEEGDETPLWQVGGRSFLDTALSLSEFVGDLPIVGYGIEGGLDVVRDLVGDTDESSVIDACFLARCLFPTLHDHRLTTVAALLEVTGETPPDLIGRVFEELVEALTDKGIAVLQVMLHLIDGTGSAMVRVLAEAANRLARGGGRGSSKMEGRQADWQEVFGIEDEEPIGEAGTPGTIDAQAIREMFDAGGLCSRHLQGYEVREPQIAMALAVAEAFNEGKFLVVEAGTGTGKSIAYLVPAVVWAVQNRTRVILSTNTKPLQDQLVTKDLPQLLSTLGTPFTYTLLKGRGNYICLNRWTAVLQRVGTSLSRDERVAALLLVVWAMETTTGDMTEHRGFDASRHAGLWNKVCSDPVFCRGSRCRSGLRCFSASARRTAQRSQVVVVNHSLLFSDLASDHAILSVYRYVVFDEAHHLEKV
ncbi:MAG: DEAD/DEAH box helicase family protein [Candidatus Latescibacteria bacterium]|nr:DEAD/DEAH box helicase family protein [Candidatus Latescibacterota bacterium]